jgi:hypothetical protein
VSAGDAWAVGDGAGLALIGRWNGSGWSVFPSPEVVGQTSRDNCNHTV